MDGEIDTHPSIDKNAPIEIAMQRPLPYVKASSSISQNLATTNSSSAIKRAMAASFDDKINDMDIGSKMAKHDSEDGFASGLTQEQIIGRISKKLDSSLSQRPITENLTDLSEQLTIEKIAAIKAKKKAQQRKQVSSAVELDDELLMGRGSSDRAMGAEYGLSSIGYASGLSTGDENEAIMKEIRKRELVSKDRFSVLQSSGKHFEKDINAFLQLIKAKEEGNSESGIAAAPINGSQPVQQSQKSRQLGYNRFDQERYAAKDETGGFSIDTKLTYQPSIGALGLVPTPNSAPTAGSGLDSQRLLTQTQLTQKNNSTVSSQSSQSRPGYKSPSAQNQKRTSTKPIIIVPNVPTSLITMINCHEILQDLKYISAEEKKKSSQNLAPKDCEIIMHRKEDGSIIQYKVIDNIQKMQPSDW